MIEVTVHSNKMEYPDDPGKQYTDVVYEVGTLTKVGYQLVTS